MTFERGGFLEPPKHPGVEHAPEVSNRRRALVADDDGDVCALLALVLKPVCDVTTVHDAESALGLLAEGLAFDVIISDFMLPGINGVEFVQRVRHDQASRTPILMISGHGAIVSERARAAGVDAFLDKPFTLSQLRATLRSLLESDPISRCA